MNNINEQRLSMGKRISTENFGGGGEGEGMFANSCFHIFFIIHNTEPEDEKTTILPTKQLIYDIHIIITISVIHQLQH